MAYNPYTAKTSDDEEYVYPTKKVKENTKNRRHSANLIEDALIGDDFENDDMIFRERTNEDYDNFDTYKAKQEDDDDLEDLGSFYDAFIYNETFGPCENDDD